MIPVQIINHCPDFDSQSCCIINKDGTQEKINILEYDSNKHYQNIYCTSGHRLKFVPKNDKRKDYFAHVEENLDNQMTEWHKDWENNFENTEVFIAKNKRRVDALVKDIAFEFDNSPQDLKFVEKKIKIDQSLGLKTIFIVNGRENVIFINGKLLKFKKNWIWNSYTCCDFIYIDLDNKIFKVNPNDIQSSMHAIKFEPKNKQDFIQECKNLTFENFEKIIYKTNGISITLAPPGSGKTYTSIQVLNLLNITNNIFEKDNKYNCVNTVFYLTKQHTAKGVILKELREQIQKEQLDIEIIDDEFNNIDIQDENIDVKKYLLSFKNSQNKKIRIVIATIDSIIHNLSNGKNNKKRNYHKDLFIDLCLKIAKEGMNVNKYGSFKIENRTIKLNAQSLIIIDEAQDLPIEYLHALIQIQKLSNCWISIIGDVLQSIHEPINILTYLYYYNKPEYCYFTNNINLDLSEINIEFEKPLDQIRRFHNICHLNWLNILIDHKKWGLEKPIKICDGINCDLDHSNDETQLQFIEICDIYNVKDETLDEYINKLINYLLPLILEQGFVPSEIMLAFPIIKNNPFAEKIQNRLKDLFIELLDNQEYITKIKNTEWYEIYIKNNKNIKIIVRHQHDEGSSIDPNESLNSSRIWSIHAAKGDGRESVLNIGSTQEALNKHTYMINDPRLRDFKSTCMNVVGNSRQKKYLLNLYVANYDEYHQKILQYKEKYGNNSFFSLESENNNINHESENNNENNKLYIPSIKKQIDLDFDKYWEYFQECYNFPLFKPNDQSNNDIQDYGKHVFRNSAFQFLFMYELSFHLSKNQENENFNEMLKILNCISNIKLITCEYDEYYKILNKIKNELKKNRYSINYFPILKFRNSNSISIYQKETKILLKMIKHIQEKLKNINKREYPKICPIESLILSHIYSYLKSLNKCDKTSINDVYDMLYDISNCSYINHSSEYFNCSCNKIFKREIDTKKNQQIMEFYSKIEDDRIEKIIKKIKDDYGIDFKDINLAINRPFYFKNKENENFYIKKNLSLIGYFKNHIIWFPLCPQYNNINYLEIDFNIAYSNFILNNLHKNSDNLKQFLNKKIIVCFCTIDYPEPRIYEFNNSINNELFLKLLIKELKSFEKNHIMIFDLWGRVLKDNNFDHYKSLIFILKNFNKINKFTQKKDIPKYIIDFFETRKNNLRKKKLEEDETNILTDKFQFLSEINEFLNDAIENYLE